MKADSCLRFTIPYHQMFRIERFLANKQKQNQPFPQGTQMKTGNKNRHNSKRRQWRRTQLSLQGIAHEVVQVCLLCLGCLQPTTPLERSLLSGELGMFYWEVTGTINFLFINIFPNYQVGSVINMCDLQKIKQVQASCRVMGHRVQNLSPKEFYLTISILLHRKCLFSSHRCI